MAVRRNCALLPRCALYVAPLSANRRLPGPHDSAACGGSRDVRRSSRDAAAERESHTTLHRESGRSGIRRQKSRSRASFQSPHGLWNSPDTASRAWDRSVSLQAPPPRVGAMVRVVSCIRRSPSIMVCGRPGGLGGGRSPTRTEIWAGRQSTRSCVRQRTDTTADDVQFAAIVPVHTDRRP